MTLMDLKKEEPITKILSKTGAQNIAFCVEIERNEFFFCSCGYSYKEGCVNNPTYLKEEEASEEEKELIEEHDIRYCPQCKTRSVYTLDDFNNDSFPVKFEALIERDDDDFFVFMINEIGIKISDMQLSYIEEESNLYVFYDKKHKVFGLTETPSDLEIGVDNVSQYEKDIDKEYKIPVCFDDGTKYCLESSRTMFWNIEFDWDIWMENEIFNRSGIKDIRKLLAEKAGLDVADDDFYSLMSLLTAFFRKINFPFDEDISNLMKKYDIRQFCTKNVNSYETILNYYKSYKKMGIDFSKNTLKDAFRIEPEDLEMCKNVEDYIIIKKFSKAIREEGIEEYVKHIFTGLDKKLSVYEINMIMLLSEKTGESIEIVLKHIFRFAKTKAEAYKIINNDIEILNSEYAHILDVNSTYSSCIYKKYVALKNNVFTESQFDRLMKKPTIDTFCKIIG